VDATNPAFVALEQRTVEQVLADGGGSKARRTCSARRVVDSGANERAEQQRVRPSGAARFPGFSTGP
jgi:hypothetical protein